MDNEEGAAGVGMSSSDEAQVPLLSINSYYNSLHLASRSNEDLDDVTSPSARYYSVNRSREYEALMKKNFLLLKRQKMLSLCQFIIPLLLTVLMGCLSIFIKEASQGMVYNSNPNVSTPLSQLDSQGYYFMDALAGPRSSVSVGVLMQNGTKTGLFSYVTQQAGEGGYYPYSLPRPNRNYIIDEVTQMKEKYFTEYSNGLLPAVTIPLATLIFNEVNTSTQTFSFEVGVEQQTGYPYTRNYTAVELAALQLMTNAFLAYVTNDNFSISVETREYPNFKVAALVDASLLAGLFYPLALSFFLPIFVHAIVLEKELGLCEMMHLMGMKKRHYWLVTYVFDMMLYLIGLAIVLLVSAAFELTVIINGSWLANIIIFFGWGNTQIAFAFFLSTFFSKTRTATTITSFLVVIGVIVSLAVNSAILGKLTANWVYGFMVYPPFSFYRAISLLGLYCGAGECPLLSDYTWDFEVTKLGTTLYISAAILFILSGYLDNIMPRKWGVAKSPLFFLNPIKNLFTKCFKQEKIYDRLLSSQGTNTLMLQGESTDAANERHKVYNKRYSPSCPIVIADLHKQYGGKVAVHNLCLAIENGECFGLLGPNGAGKTTTISILTGSIPPTSGSISIEGLDLKTHLDEIRKKIGVCPQFDILWDRLTARETVLFYARLKGVPKNDELRQTESWLEEVGLLENADVEIHELSGGDRRKISIVASLLGQPRIIILDEPTTGLDPESRRQIWELIQKVKRGRCMILTTHSMEEADMLCNRVGMISKGKLLCIGSQSELKHKFGTGYRVFVTFEPINEQRVKNFMKTSFPTAVLSEHFAGYYVYRLPYSDARVSSVLEIMQKNQQAAGVLEWGISQSSLEDVFMQVILPTQQADLS